MVQQKTSNRIVTRDAIPGFALFSYDLKTNECKQAAKQEFTQEELKNGVRKQYVFMTGNGLIFLQAATEKKAKRQFERFILEKRKKLKI